MQAPLASGPTGFFRLCSIFTAPQSTCRSGDRKRCVSCIPPGADNAAFAASKAAKSVAEYKQIHDPVGKRRAQGRFAGKLLASLVRARIELQPINNTVIPKVVE
jgi:hypothetical protein